MIHKDEYHQPIEMRCDGDDCKEKIVISFPDNWPLLRLESLAFRRGWMRVDNLHLCSVCGRCYFASKILS